MKPRRDVLLFRFRVTNRKDRVACNWQPKINSLTIFKYLICDDPTKHRSRFQRRMFLLETLTYPFSINSINRFKSASLSNLTTS